MRAALSSVPHLSDQPLLSATIRVLGHARALACRLRRLLAPRLAPLVSHGAARRAPPPPPRAAPPASPEQPRRRRRHAQPLPVRRRRPHACWIIASVVRARASTSASRLNSDICAASAMMSLTRLAAARRRGARQSPARLRARRAAAFATTSHAHRVRHQLRSVSATPPRAYVQAPAPSRRRRRAAAVTAFKSRGSPEAPMPAVPRDERALRGVRLKPSPLEPVVAQAVHEHSHGKLLRKPPRVGFPSNDRAGQTPRQPRAVRPRARPLDGFERGRLSGRLHLGKVRWRRRRGLSGASTRARPAAVAAESWWCAPPRARRRRARVASLASRRGADASSPRATLAFSTLFLGACARAASRLPPRGPRRLEAGLQGTRRISLGMGQGFGFRARARGPPCVSPSAFPSTSGWRGPSRARRDGSRRNSSWFACSFWRQHGEAVQTFVQSCRRSTTRQKWRLTVGR